MLKEWGLFLTLPHNWPGETDLKDNFAYSGEILGSLYGYIKKIPGQFCLFPDA